MKITIELSEAEVRGIKAYLKEVSGEVNPKITKEEIKHEINGIINSTFQSPHSALADYIQLAEKGLL